MTQPTAPLNKADQVLANVLAWLQVHIVQDRPREDMMLEILREVLPRVNRRHPLVGPLAAAADSYLSFTLGARAHKAMMRARLDAEPAVRAFLEWRAAMALEALRAEVLAE